MDFKMNQISYITVRAVFNVDIRNVPKLGGV